MAAETNAGQVSARALMALAFITSLAALLAGCAPPWASASGPRPLPASQQIAHVTMRPLTTPQYTLDPARVLSWGGAAQIVELLYSGLLTLDAHNSPVPALASRYDVSADGLRYTFHLRGGARFADGTPITASDVAYSLNRAMTDCQSVAPWAFIAVKDQPAITQPCQNSSTPAPPGLTTLVGDALLVGADNTVTIVLTRPDPTLMEKLAMPSLLIVERSVVERYGDSWTAYLTDRGGQGTSGMYALHAMTAWGRLSGVSGDVGSLTLRPAPGYWGPAPQLRQVDITLEETVESQDSQTTFLPLAAQGADLVLYDVLSIAPPTAKVNGLVYHSAPAPQMDFLTLNATTPPLDDIRVRQALALALDKTALAQLVNGLPTNHIVPPGVGANPATLTGTLVSAPLTGDEARARGLWQSYVADHCGGVASACASFGLYNYPTFSSNARVFDEAVIARWQSVLPGIQAQTRDYPDTLYVDPSYFPGADHWYWPEDYPDPSDYLDPLVKPLPAPLPAFPPGVSYPPLVADPQAIALVSKADAATDPIARLALYQQAEASLVNEAYIIPLYQQQVVWAASPRLAHVPPDIAPWIAPADWARIELMSAS